jgi:hypothetical protein
MLRRRVIVGVLGGLLLAWQAGCSSEGDALPWQAFYLPSSALVEVSTQLGPCESDAAITDEGSTVVAVTARQIDQPPGHGSCPSPLGSRPLELSAPVGSRKIQASDGSTGQAFNLATRLHQPGTSSDAMPWGGRSVHSTEGDTWSLAYQDPSHHFSYLLTSEPDDHTHKTGVGTVRGRPTVTPCVATLCWRENGLLYSIGPISGPADPQYLTVAQARAMVATLV